MSFGFHWLLTLVKTFISESKTQVTQSSARLCVINLTSIKPLLRIQTLSILNNFNLHRFQICTSNITHDITVIAEFNRFTFFNREKQTRNVAICAGVCVDFKAERRNDMGGFLGLHVCDVQGIVLLRLEFVERRCRDCDDSRSSHAVLRFDLLDVRLASSITPNRRFRRIFPFKNFSYKKFQFFHSF